MAFTHRKADTSKSKADTSKSKASKSKASKSTTEYITRTLDTKDFVNLRGTVTVKLTEDSNPKSKRVAWGSLVIGDCFAIHISVYEGKNGYFISYPNYKDSEGNYHDLAYCFDAEVIEGLKDLITDMIEDEDDDGDLPF